MESASGAGMCEMTQLADRSNAVFSSIFLFTFTLAKPFWREA